MRILDNIKIGTKVKLYKNNQEWICIEKCGFVEMCDMGIALVKCNTKHPHSRPDITIIKWLYGKEIQNKVSEIL